MKRARFDGRLVIVGFGSIGQGVLPLILRHIEIDAVRIVIVTSEERGSEIAREHGVRFINRALTKDNYRDVLDPLIGAGDFLLNVSVGVSSVALIEYCRDRNALYLDTCFETWAGDPRDAASSPSSSSSYALREAVLEMRGKPRRGATAVLTHGANPGLVSHFVKRALITIAADVGIKSAVPQGRAAWADLMRKLGIKVIHIAERDTQVGNRVKRAGEFVNTWSIDGFYAACSAPAELGWGSHERGLPADGNRHGFGSDCAIYLKRPGASVRVRSWTPLGGSFLGFLIAHEESISIADYFTARGRSGASYRPTVHYAYLPCGDAVLSLKELANKKWRLQRKKRLMTDEIVSGIDELGVLLMGHAKGAYWYGSQLSIEEARKLVPHNNATGLQVTIAVLAGLVWAIENPEQGIVEPEDMDFERILAICEPYLGRVVGTYTGWTPLTDPGRSTAADVDMSDPWQFRNFRVA